MSGARDLAASLSRRVTRSRPPPRATGARSGRSPPRPPRRPKEAKKVRVPASFASFDASLRAKPCRVVASCHHLWSLFLTKVCPFAHTRHRRRPGRDAAPQQPHGTVDSNPWADLSDVVFCSPLSAGFLPISFLQFSPLVRQSGDLRPTESPYAISCSAFDVSRASNRGVTPSRSCQGATHHLRLARRRVRRYRVPRVVGPARVLFWVSRNTIRQPERGWALWPRTRRPGERFSDSGGSRAGAAKPS
jgi:hypothetical protein